MNTFQRKTKILLCIVCVLIACSIFLSVDWKHPKAETSELVLSAVISDVATVTIIFNRADVQKTIALKKRDDSFFLYFSDDETYKVPETVMKNFFTILSSKNKMTLVSKNNTTTLVNTVKIMLRSASETVISDITFGELDTLGLNRYIMFGGGHIYKAPDIYASLLQPENSRWIETQPFKAQLKNNSIQSVSINDKLFIKNERNAAAFTALEQALSSFHVLDVYIVNAYPAANLKREKQTVSFVLGSGETVSLHFQKIEIGSDYTLYQNDKKQPPYIVSSYAVEQLLKAVQNVQIP